MKSDYSYQIDAIHAIKKKFTKNKIAKTLLVIPTGGGKTLTAIRAINSMLEDQLLNSTDCVYWVVHSVALCIQTQNVLDNNIIWGKFLNNLENCHSDLGNVIKVKMLTDAINNHRNDKPKIIIIDEAHHSAAPSYKDFFNLEYGVLGLTATPTRNDDSILEYDDIVYSITTRELINRNVIIKPIIHSHKTSQVIDLSSLDDEKSSRFDFLARNKFVATKVFNNRKMYSKAILYVRTREHAINLCNILKDYNSRFGNDYDHIGYILGGDENSEKTTNDKYLSFFKKQKKALVVNCGVLTEGFDDPSIDTVIMVVPTSSIIYYLQCIGRAIRTPQDQSLNKAFVVEFEDEMPNINYRINNKWLFADISDNLEPEVLERNYSSKDNYKEILNEIGETYKLSVDQLRVDNISLEDLERTNILVYNPSKELRDNAWKIIQLDSENYEAYATTFNVLCNDITRNFKEFQRSNINWLFEEKYKFKDPDGIFEHEYQRTNIKTALEYAFKEKQDNKKVDRLKYFIFHKVDDIPQGLTDFLDVCVNKHDLLNDLEQMKNNGYTSIIKIPLILGGFEGVYLNQEGKKFCQEYIQSLENLKLQEDWYKWPQAIFNQNYLLTDIPIPQRQFNSLPMLLTLQVKDFIFDI